MSKRALCATRIAPRGRTRGTQVVPTRYGAASVTIAVVIPVRVTIWGGMGATGIDEGGELADHLAAPDLHGADLGDAVACGIGPGGLEVDDDEGGVEECPVAELVRCRVATGA